MLAHTCLKNSFLLDGVDFSEDRRLRAELERFAPGEVALLFPGPSARPIEEARGTLKCLLVLDGTWNEAKKILHYTPFLQALPRVAFAPAEPSTYRIRKEPRPECVSTIEAIAHSLRALGEDEEVSRNLKAAFDLMVERQLAFGHSAPRQKLSMQRREQRLREGFVNWWLKSTNPEQVKAYLRGEIDLPGRPKWVFRDWTPKRRSEKRPSGEEPLPSRSL